MPSSGGSNQQPASAYGNNPGAYSSQQPSAAYGSNLGSHPNQPVGTTANTVHPQSHVAPAAYDNNAGTYSSQPVGTTAHTAHPQSHITPGQGTADQTAGPHNSNLMNKLDPRGMIHAISIVQQC